MKTIVRDWMLVIFMVLCMWTGGLSAKMDAGIATVIDCCLFMFLYILVIIIWYKLQEKLESREDK